MKDLLVGSTGFVGGNLMAKHNFEAVCHSSDISNYYGSNPELCVYSGVPAAMYLANANPAADLEMMKNARENLLKIKPKKVVLISSIAVYDDSRGKNENSLIDETKLTAYGKNRLQLEKWVREDFSDSLIIRLPALYGIGLKKNFLYDLHTVTPAMLKPEKYEELSSKSNLIKAAYTLADNGFYKLNGTVDEQKLKKFFESNDFNAIAFTDSRSKYQFYNLGRLWSDIEIALNNNITMLNISTPPVSALEVYKVVTGKTEWKNELKNAPYDYDMKSIYSDLFSNNTEGYLCSKNDELNDICKFMTDRNDRR